jgi:hypothetical protein
MQLLSNAATGSCQCPAKWAWQLWAVTRSISLWHQEWCGKTHTRSPSMSPRHRFRDGGIRCCTAVHPGNLVPPCHVTRAIPCPLSVSLLRAVDACDPAVPFRAGKQGTISGQLHQWALEPTWLQPRATWPDACQVAPGQSKHGSATGNPPDSLCLVLR